MIPRYFLAFLLLIIFPLVFSVRVSVDVNVNSNSPNRRMAMNQAAHRRIESIHSESPIAETMSAAAAADDDDDESSDDATAIVASHNTVDNCWVVLNGAVMNITNFEHPFKDGLAHIAKACGFSVTKTLHAKHRDEYDEQMKLFKINPKTGQFFTDQKQNPLSKLGGAARDSFVDELKERRRKFRAKLLAKVRKMGDLEMQATKMMIERRAPGIKMTSGNMLAAP